MSKILRADRPAPDECLRIRNDSDGTWLELTTKSGREAAIHMDMVGPHDERSSIRSIIDEWCQDREDESGVKNERRPT